MLSLTGSTLINLLLTKSMLKAKEMKPQLECGVWNSFFLGIIDDKIS